MKFQWADYNRAGLPTSCARHVSTTLHTADLPGLSLVHRGKVRDVFALDSDRLLMVATDRLSAFDVVLLLGSGSLGLCYHFFVLGYVGGCGGAGVQKSTTQLNKSELLIYYPFLYPG